MPKIGTLSTFESGVDLVVEWKIENFFNLPQSDGAYYYSPDFCFGGERWYLWIRPNGWSRSDSSGHVDLELYKCGSDRSIKQSFSLSLKTAKGEKYNEQNGTKDFEEGLDWHSFNPFIQRSELTRRRYELMPDGVLTVVCTMKSSTSDGSASNTESTYDKCCHCKITFNAQNLSSHQRKCMHRPIKCPDCLEVVVLQKWLDEHKCQKERSEAVKSLEENSKNNCVEACTETKKENDYNCCGKLLMVFCIASITIIIMLCGDLVVSNEQLQEKTAQLEAVAETLKARESELNAIKKEHGEFQNICYNIVREKNKLKHCLDSEKQNLVMSNEQLQEKIAQLEAVAETLKARESELNAIKKEHGELKCAYESIASEKNKLKHCLDSEKQNLVMSNEQLQEKTAHLKAVAETLKARESELNAIKKKHGELKSTCYESIAREKNKLKHCLDSEKQNLVMSNEQLQEKIAQLEAVAETLKARESELNAIKKEHGELKCAYESIASEKNKLKHCLDSEKQNLVMSNEQLQEKTAHLKAVAETLKARESELNAIKKKHGELKSTCYESIAREKNKLKHCLDSEKQNLVMSNEQLQEKIAQLEAVAETLKARESELNAIKKEHGELKCAYESIASEKNKLKHCLDSEKQNLVMSNEQLQEKTAHLKAVAETLKARESELNAIKKKHGELKSTCYESIAREKNKLKHCLDSEKQNWVQLKKEIEEKQSKIDSITKELRKKETDFNDFKKTNEKLILKIKEIESEKKCLEEKATENKKAVKKIQTSENNKANNRSDVVGSNEFEASSSNETSTTDIKKSEGINKTLAAEMNKTDKSEFAGSDIPEASAAVRAATDESEPLPQPVLMVTEVSSTYLEVVWVLPEESKTNAAHIHYIVLFRKCETQWQEVSFLNASRTSYSLTNLNSGMPYQIYVMAVDSRFSRPSEIATVRTSDKVVNHSPSKGHGKHVLVYAATIIILVIVIASVYSYSKTSFSALHHYGVTFNNPPEDCGFVTDINHLLNENRGIDVTFELETPNGKTKLFAHKLILAVMSSYFADEFYDKGRNKGHQVIPLNGIDPKAFEQMIRYCYGGKPSLITTEEVCALFKVAFEFKVISLQNLCHTSFKHTKIEPGNVFSILKISMEMEDKSLKDMCYQILQEKTREVMTAYELCDITPAMVYTLLKLPKLSLNSEYELIKWIFEWAKVKSENAREYLERLLKDMNFLALRFEEFATLCKDYQGFFNSDEIASIYQNIAHAKTREMPEWFNNDLKCRVYTGSN